VLDSGYERAAVARSGDPGGVPRRPHRGVVRLVGSGAACRRRHGNQPRRRRPVGRPCGLGRGDPRAVVPAVRGANASAAMARSARDRH